MPATFGRCLLLPAAVLLLGTPAYPQTLSKLDPLAGAAYARGAAHSRVIVRATGPEALDAIVSLIDQTGGTPGRRLPLLDAVVAEVPTVSLAVLSESPLVKRIALDRSIHGTLNRTAAAIGVPAVRDELGYDGAGVGVAVIDSGVAAWHDDLATADGAAQRVEAFVDFVEGRTVPYDDYGHGTHVAGIIAGNGFDSAGARAGIAPAVRLVVMKVLDGAGRGHISDVIAAIGYAVEHRHTYGLRIINLSIGAGVFESAATDMLSLAAKKAVDQGIVVIASAGNFGKGADGRPRYGGITAPGNAPWVLTVGASSHMGTVDRADDTIASFSSRGPTAIDRFAKPDLVAPGVGTESLTDPASALFAAKPLMRINGILPTPYAPYLSLSGTSQAAPVVAGVVALMLQANPSLSPNAVKAILQYTAKTHGYDPLTQGAGFVDAPGAVSLARHFASPGLVPYPADTARWSGQVIWGNHRVRPARLVAQAAIWQSEIVWGAAKTAGGLQISVTPTCLDLQCPPPPIVAPISVLGAPPPPVSSVALAENVVWGTVCAGTNCAGLAWTARNADAWGTADDGDTVVWGTADDGDTVVWGTSDNGDTVVWGTSDSGDTVVWGTSGDDDVTWDRSAEEPEPRPMC
jgi:serine protease AprX